MMFLVPRENLGGEGGEEGLDVANMVLVGCGLGLQRFVFYGLVVAVGV